VFDLSGLERSSTSTAPRAIARIEQMLTALENYQTVASPRGTSTSGNSATQESVARQTDAHDDEPPPKEDTDS